VLDRPVVPVVEGQRGPARNADVEDRRKHLPPFGDPMLQHGAAQECERLSVGRGHDASLPNRVDLGASLSTGAASASIR
jgi:hypothetical protein